MPTGYSGEGKTYSKKLGKWLKTKKEAAFDYDEVDQDSAAFLLSFFRAYVDYFCDIFRSPNAEYKLELPQRLMMRIMARNRNVYIQGCRGISKTYCLLLTKMAIGILWTGEVCRYSAPNQKQAAAIAAQAFHQIEKDYPDLAAMWQLRNDRADMFRITSQYGSEISMYAPRGSNAHSVVGEECAQESPEPFDMDAFEKSILPTVRLIRQVNKHKDVTHINLQHTYITNASSEQNRAFSVHRAAVLKDMLFGERGDGYVIDIPWEVAVLGGIRDIAYVKDQKTKLTPENFLREMCARNTGTSESAMITDEVLSRSRQLFCMEDKHCGDENAIYIVCHDVAYEDGQKNAKCGQCVIKLTPFTTASKRGKYRKQVVYVNGFPPPKDTYEHAMQLKRLWRSYCMDGGQPTYLVIDVQGGYGRAVVEMLMRPTLDGSLPLCCYEHMRYQELEQPHALPIIYPMKSGTRGTEDEEGVMIQYAQLEFEQGNVELLTPRMMDGIEQYKLKHNIKDNGADGRISIPYKKTEELCQQISNLRTKVSGTTLKEERQSKSIQRDIFSALKYGLRLAQRLEDKNTKELAKKESSWDDEIARFKNGQVPTAIPQGNSDRSRLIGLRGSIKR